MTPREIIAAATAGPWRVDGVDIDQLTDGGKGYPLDTYPDSAEVAVGRCEDCGSYKPGIQRGEDARFIAAAREGWEQALDRVDELERERDAMEQDIGDWVGRNIDNIRSREVRVALGEAADGIREGLWRAKGDSL